MLHRLIVKVTKFQLLPPKRLGTVAKNILGGHDAPMSNRVNIRHHQNHPPCCHFRHQLGKFRRRNLLFHHQKLFFYHQNLLFHHQKLFFHHKNLLFHHQNLGVVRAILTGGAILISCVSSFRNCRD